MTLKEAKLVDATQSVMFSYPHIPPTMLVSNTNDNAYEITTYVLLCLLIAGLGAFLFIKLSKRGHLTTEVYLEITTGSQCALIKIMSLPSCPNFWHITASHPCIQDLEVIKQNWPRLTINWGNLTFKNTLSAQIIRLPSRVALPLYQILLVPQLLQQPICSFIVVKHGSICIKPFICPITCDGTQPHCSMPDMHIANAQMV